MVRCRSCPGSVGLVRLAVTRGWQGPTPSELRVGGGGLLPALCSCFMAALNVFTISLSGVISCLRTYFDLARLCPRCLHKCLYSLRSSLPGWPLDGGGSALGVPRQKAPRCRWFPAGAAPPVYPAAPRWGAPAAVPVWPGPVQELLGLIRAGHSPATSAGSVSPRRACAALGGTGGRHHGAGWTGSRTRRRPRAWVGSCRKGTTLGECGPCVRWRLAAWRRRTPKRGSPRRRSKPRGSARGWRVHRFRDWW